MANQHFLDNRRSIRLRGYDYTQAGLYYITICTNDRLNLFGIIQNGEMVVNDFGRIVEKVWSEIPNHFPNVDIDEFIVMPNHIHGILLLFDDASKNSLSESKVEAFGKPVVGSVPTIVRSYKSAVTRQIRELQSSSMIGEKAEVRVKISENGISGHGFCGNGGCLHYVGGCGVCGHGVPCPYGVVDNVAVVWQRNYFERIIKNEKVLEKVRQYIIDNPLNWDRDQDNISVTPS